MHNRFRHQYWSVLLFLCICRRCSWYKHTLSPHLLQLTIRLLASSFSSIFLRAVCNTAHEGSPFLETLSCCFSHAAIIFLLLFSMSPRCSSSLPTMSAGTPLIPSLTLSCLTCITLLDLYYFANQLSSAIKMGVVISKRSRFPSSLTTFLLLMSLNCWIPTWLTSQSLVPSSRKWGGTVAR